MVQKPNYATVTATQWLSQLCLPWNLKLKKTRKGRQTSRQSFWAVLANVVLQMHINCYFLASDQNSDIAITFSDPDFLKHSNYLAIIHFQFTR